MEIWKKMWVGVFSEHSVVSKISYLSGVVLVALLVARRTNNRKVVGSMPAVVVSITVDR